MDEDTDNASAGQRGHGCASEHELHQEKSGDCDEALRTLYSFLDGELTTERRTAIQEHLDRCSPCLEAFDFEAELKMVVARCCRDQVPDHLRRRVADALSQASEGPGNSV
jgi:mycothiol system anti-sigma-R factor